MALKLLLLAAAAVAVFVITRPRGVGRKRGRVSETKMTKCARCGVYHPAEETCACEKE